MASQSPFPLMPPKSTELRMLHFDDYAYTGTSSTVLYRYVDALCGTTGAGALVNEIFLARMGGALQTIYFNELDYIFGKISFLARSSAESYPYDPTTDMLTSDQWDEVRIKDAWYRARITDFFKACSLGGTPDGVRMTIQAALAVDCDIYEVWRYLDNFGSSQQAWDSTWPGGVPQTIQDNVGRAPVQTAWGAINLSTGQIEHLASSSAALTYVANHPGWAVQKFQSRNEMVVRPHKSELLPEELRLCRDMLGKIMPLDTIVTVNTTGLAVMAPVTVEAAAADTTYYEVQQVVTATPALAQLPPPELLPIDLLPSETWLYEAQNSPTLAPYAAFNISSEYGYYYLVGGGKRSPIDSVSYGTLQEDGTVLTERNFQVYSQTGQYGPKTPYAKADSPDNYPGGKYGVHPDTAPAINPDGSGYIFAATSQQAFIASEAIRIEALGGLADADGFSLPISANANSARVFYPDYAVSYFPPSKDSDVTTAVTRRRTGVTQTPELRDPTNFIRSS